MGKRPCDSGVQRGCCRGMGKLRQGCRGLQPEGMGGVFNSCLTGRTWEGAALRAGGLGELGAVYLHPPMLPVPPSVPVPQTAVSCFRQQLTPRGCCARRGGARGPSALAWHGSVTGLTVWGGDWGDALHGPSVGQDFGLWKGYQSIPWARGQSRLGIPGWGPARGRGSGASSKGRGGD